MRDRSSTESASDPKKVPRVTAHYDAEQGLTFHKQASSSVSGPAYLLDEDEAELEHEVQLTVVRAGLVRSFEPQERRRASKLAWPLAKSFRMETYASVDWISGEKVEPRVARTHTDREGHLTPEWNSTCHRRPYLGAGERIRLQVYEDSGSKPTLCGEAFASLDELLGLGAAENGGSSASSCSGSRPGPLRELPLELPGPARERTGVVVVQAQLAPPEASDEPPLTRVDPELFESDIKRVGVSGGTAPFFRLRLKEEFANGCSRAYYIGKDLSHAADEVLFYEKARSILMSPQRDKGLASLLGFMFEYAGILSCGSDVGGEAQDKPMDLLVLRNLYDGCKKLRLLDLKIGQKTGSAGWQGKSQTASMRQAVIDGVTNSSCEGFRLEGFDGAPQSVATMNPLIDFGGGSEKAMKKAFRMMLQRMTGAEVLMHFIDVHQELGDPGDEALAELRSPTELAELVLRETVRRLATLAAASRRVPTPQKWIGSSVALAFDCGSLPSRAAPEAEVCGAVKVHIFDWGRSELNTPENHKRLSPEQRQDRATFWEYYAGGIDRLAWEAARAYWHRFGNEGDWREAFVTLMDFDSHSANDFIGRVQLRPLEEHGEITVPLRDEAGAEVRGSRWGETATLTYSVQRRRYPKGSPLAGAWRVTVVRADNLPRCNWTYGTTDAFAELTAISADGSKRFRQVTSVQQNTLCPAWGEALELPCAAGPELLRQQLCSVVDGLGDGRLDLMLPCEQKIVRTFAQPESMIGPDDEGGFAHWTERLNRAAPTAWQAAARSPEALNRRLVCGQSVSIMEQSGFANRLVAILAGALAFAAAPSLLLNAPEPASQVLRRDPTVVLFAACQLVLALSVLLFELPPQCLARHGALDGFHDFLLEHAGCLAKVKSRGLVYDLQGFLWIGEWVHTSCSRPFLLGVGLSQFLVGMLHVCASFGLAQLRIVRKVHRVWTG